MTFQCVFDIMCKYFWTLTLSEKLYKLSKVLILKKKSKDKLSGMSKQYNVSCCSLKVCTTFQVKALTFVFYYKTLWYYDTKLKKNCYPSSKSFYSLMSSVYDAVFSKDTSRKMKWSGIFYYKVWFKYFLKYTKCFFCYLNKSATNF